VFALLWTVADYYRPSRKQGTTVMIQRSGVSSFWQGFTCVFVLIVLTGCHDSSPVAAPTNVGAAAVSEESHSTSVESDAVAASPQEEAAEIEVASPSEQVAQAAPAHSEAAPTPKETPQKIPPKPVAPPQSPNATKKPKVALSVPDPPEYVFEPQVLMSQQDMDTCLIKTGDPFPDAQLSDREGQEHSLKELLGEKLTVIVFWSNANRLGREQIQRLDAEIVVPFEKSGLNVVAINISDSAEQISEAFPADRKVGFTILLDLDATLFSKVATQRHPRTYLLDAKGNILWYDIEYSRSTVRELVNAIHVNLGNYKFGES
jgi:peroxiredoxin